MQAAAEVEVFHLPAHRRAIEEHAAGHPDQPQGHRPRQGPRSVAHLRRQRRDEFATDEHEHRHAHQRQQGRQVVADHRGPEPALQLHRGQAQQAGHGEDHQGAPHAEGEDHFGATEGGDPQRIQQAEAEHHADAHQPGAAARLGKGIQRLEVDQRHGAAEHGLGGAGEHMDDQVGRQRAGDREEAPEAARQVVVDRATGRQQAGGLGEGGGLRQHQQQRHQHRHGEGSAAQAEAGGGGEDHRAGHDQPDRTGQGGGETNPPAEQVLGESGIGHRRILDGSVAVVVLASGPARARQAPCGTRRRPVRSAGRRSVSNKRLPRRAAKEPNESAHPDFIDISRRCTPTCSRCTPRSPHGPSRDRCRTA
ncbi:hypothetical protein V554_00069 [Pseudomonas aeruginosa BWH053]|nr:hypothetical protein V561_02083 [Pseudomonas aeruginosa BWH060]EZP00316.1 hypothetical protein V554_00069 [Pseudomonas aeruginosa BWH053]